MPSEPSPPSLLIAPLVRLSADERAEFNTEVLDVGKAMDGVVISIPFPIALYHRIDGVWIPVSDLGAFNSPHPIPSRDESDSHPVPSVACEDADED